MIVCTWNSQGYKFGNGIIQNLLKNEGCYIDILCLQECGYLSNICFTHRKNNVYYGIWKLDKNANYHVLYYPWRGGNRCSMTILIRETIMIEQFACLTPIASSQYAYEEQTESDTGEDQDRKGLRGMLHVRLDVSGRKYRVANVHLPSGAPKFARKIGYTFLSMYFMRTDNVIMIGDFNTEPNSWNRNILGNIYKFCGENNITHYNPPKCLDYMITTIISEISSKVVYPGDSDHAAVIFEI